ncbi:MAG: hypothetical protein ABI599_08135 [Flavobacteriales bacterium]
MLRKPSIALALLLAIAAPAQEDASLTKEFAGMSAKERSNLAKQELKEADHDEVFLGLMAQAETAFKAGHFEEARQHYADARARRPLNVYPKVKLEDLDAMIAKRAAEEAAKAIVVEAPVVVPVAIAAPDTLRAPAIQHNAAPTPVVPPVAEEKAPAKKHVESPPAPPEEKKTIADPAPVPLAEGERTYMEGNAKVLEITVSELKHLVVYKKVQHPWGQVYYFKDGESIAQRVWHERFGDTK